MTTQPLDIPPELLALETDLFDLGKFLSCATSTGFTLEGDLLRIPSGKELDPEEAVGLIARGFAESFRGLNDQERAELLKLARRDLLRLIADSSVMAVESGFISLPNLFIGIPLARWKEQLPDPSLPPRLVLAPKILDALLGKTENPEQLALMIRQVVIRPLTGKFALDDTQRESLAAVLGVHWTGQRPLSTAQLVQAIGKLRVRRMIETGALAPPPQMLLIEEDGNNVPEMVISEDVKKEARERETDHVTIVAERLQSLFGVSEGLQTRLKQQLEAAGLSRDSQRLSNLEPITSFLVNLTSASRGQESRRLLAHRLQRMLIEKGPFEIRLIPMEQAPIVTRTVLHITFAKEYKLKDGQPNKQLFIRTLTDLFFPGAGGPMRDLLEDPEILNPKTSRLEGYERFLDELKAYLPQDHPTRTCTNELLVEQLKSKKIIEVQPTTVRERVASGGLELNLARLPLEEKVRDLDGTNLGSFGSPKDVAEVMAAWALDKDKHFDVATTLQTLYEKGRLDVLNEAMSGPWLKNEAKQLPGQSRLLITARVILAQVLGGAEAVRLGDIALNTDCLVPFSQSLGESGLTVMAQGLMGWRMEEPFALSAQDRQTLARFLSLVLTEAGATSHELLREQRLIWLHALAQGAEALLEAARRGKGPLLFAPVALLETLAAASPKALQQLLPAKPHQGLLPLLSRLSKPLGTLGETDTDAMKHLAMVSHKLGYTPKEPGFERVTLLLRRYRPELLQEAQKQA